MKPTLRMIAQQPTMEFAERLEENNIPVLIIEGREFIDMRAMQIFMRAKLEKEHFERIGSAEIESKAQAQVQEKLVGFINAIQQMPGAITLAEIPAEPLQSAAFILGARSIMGKVKTLAEATVKELVAMSEKKATAAACEVNSPLKTIYDEDKDRAASERKREELNENLTFRADDDFYSAEDRRAMGIKVPAPTVAGV